MAVEILKETTKWSDETPNHVYAVRSDSSKMIGFRHTGTNEVTIMSKPLTFDKRGRTFKRVTDNELYLRAISA